MNIKTSIAFDNLLLGLAIALSYSLISLPSDAEPNKQKNVPEANLASKIRDIKIAQTKTIQKVQLVGNTILTTEEINPILQSLSNQAIDPETVEAIAEALTQIYVSKGYVTSLVKFDPQDPNSIINGVAQIKAIEGQIERIDIVGLSHTNPDYVRSRLNLGITNPFNANQIEDQLRLLRSDPLFRNVTSSLKPSNTEGKSLLVVQVEEVNQLTGSVSFDNYSPVSVGSERMGVGLNYRNLT